MESQQKEFENSLTFYMIAERFKEQPDAKAVIVWTKNREPEILLPLAQYLEDNT